LGRVRTGDQAAARELVEKYEPVIRRAVRVWLVNARIRRAFDSLDICQSLWGSFFHRAAQGDYDVVNQHQLVQLFRKMARNKVADLIRHQFRQRRDVQRLQPGDAADLDVARGDPTPSQEVAHHELFQEFVDRLSEEERWLADQRVAGREWADIAA